MKPYARRKSGGFTIAELAVATAILALLLFSAMVPFSSQMDIRNISETRRTMDTVRDAIIGFAQANGRLPCPADGSVPAGNAGAGLELFSVNSCTTVMGVVPWATLGAPETDSWGRRFTYRVAPAFADAVSLTTWNSASTANPYPNPAGYLIQQPSSPTASGLQQPTCDLKVAPTSSSFALCSLGDITVLTRGPSAASILAPALPAVVISHGKNGYGGWQSNGIRFSPIPAAGDELANVNGTQTATPPGGFPNSVFYSRNPSNPATGCSDPAPFGSSGSPLCEFDDIVVMISSNVLIARMVAAGKLP